MHSASYSATLGGVKIRAFCRILALTIPAVERKSGE
jgi:hypothetical protein